MYPMLKVALCFLVRKTKFDISFFTDRITGHSRLSESTFHCLILLSDQPIVIYLDSSLFHNPGTKINAHERFLPRFYAPYAIPTIVTSPSLC
jgi:hypothetical protein